MSHPHYSRAPIVEAIIDVRIDPVQDGALSAIEAVATALGDEFPISSPIAFGKFALAIRPLSDEPDSPSISGSQQRVGVRLARPDNSRILQLRTNGFSYSHLPPYSNWPAFRLEATRLWNAYSGAVRPLVVSRIAVRYINRFELPGPSVEPKDFFTLYPSVPDEIPQDITGMFVQLQMPQLDLDGMAILNMALADPTNPNTVAIILDFDVFVESKMTLDSDDMWRKIDLLRDRKNDLFNACITERTKELIR